MKNELSFKSHSNEEDAPKVLLTDNAYSHYGSPIVLEKYKLIFFINPKVACSDFKILLRRMHGDPDIKERKHIHEQHFPQLHDYPLDVASDMMNSPDWTKAIFLRDPKERFLSAYLNKAVKDTWYFKQECCDLIGEEQCNRYWWSFEEFVDMTEYCHDVHWNPQYSLVDAKFWPLINFVGDFKDLANESERLLKKIGNDAWERYGSTGWGEDGTYAMFKSNSAGHKTGSHDKMKLFYTPDLDEVVKERFSKDYQLIDYYFGN